MIYRLVGGFLLLAALILALYTGYDFFPFKKVWSSANPAKRISLMVENDIKKLATDKELPDEWRSISKITYKFESSLVKTLMSDQRPSFQLAKSKHPSSIKPKEYELEVDVLDVPDDENPGFIFQMSLLDLETKNKIYELGRTYHWSTINRKDLDEKKPD